MTVAVENTRIQADETSIDIRNETVESDFGRAITFRADVIGTNGKIVGARVFVLAALANKKQVYRVEPFEPDTSVALRAVWNTQGQTIPPWQTFQFQWEITDEFGNVELSELIEFEYSDDTHPWKTLTDGSVSVYWFDQTDSFGKTLLKVAQKSFKQVSEATNYSPDREIRVVLYPSQKTFVTIFPKSTQSVEDWKAGLTFDTMTVQWLDRRDGGAFTLNQVIPHEFAHAFLFFRLKGNMTEMPSWFDEGQAVNNEFTGVPQAINRARAKARRNKALRFYQIEIYPNSSAGLDALNDWYDQAASMVNFLYTKYERKVLGKIVDALNTGITFEASLKSATGLTMSEFETEWRKWIGAPPLKAADLLPTATFEMPSFPPTRDHRATPTSKP